LDKGKDYTTRSYPKLWQWAYSELEIRSVLNVGCEEGHLAKFFQDFGCDVSAVVHDFSKGPFVSGKKYDLVWSYGFVDCIPKKYLNNFLTAFDSAKKYIILTYTEPGQKMAHQVNCQPREYWTERMSRIGFRSDVVLTFFTEELAGRKDFSHKWLVFVRCCTLRERIFARFRTVSLLCLCKTVGLKNFYFLKYLKKKIQGPGTRLSVLLKTLTKYFQLVYLASICRPALRTYPVKCNTSASAEVHTLVCHHHLHRYILAIKSFLKFYGNICVVAHDDGTLSGTDKKILTEHISGIRIICKDDADKMMSEALREFPACLEYRKKYIIGMQLFDYLLISETEKIVSLDSDTLFLERPDQLIAWLSSEKNELSYLYEINPFKQEELLSKIKEPYETHLCAAFMCLYRDVLDLPLVEDLLLKMKRVEELNWWTTQNIYPVLIKRKNIYKTSYFDYHFYQDPDVFKFNYFIKNTKPVFRHYCFKAGSALDVYGRDIKLVTKRLINGAA
jgi:hypothetical protein